jgi:hypothetical protein
VWCGYWSRGLDAILRIDKATLMQEIHGIIEIKESKKGRREMVTRSYEWIIEGYQSADLPSEVSRATRGGSGKTFLPRQATVLQVLRVLILS